MENGQRLQRIHPIYDRKLVRPQINWWKAGTFVGCLLLVCIITAAALFEVMMGYSGSRNKYDIVIYLLLGESAMSLECIFCSQIIAVWIIKIYQRYASAQTRLRCCYIPSCSEYAILAIKKYGAFYGGYKAVCRIDRCGTYGGIDYP